MNAIFSLFRGKNSIPLFIEINIAFFYYKGTHWSKHFYLYFFLCFRDLYIRDVNDRTLTDD